MNAARRQSFASEGGGAQRASVIAGMALRRRGKGSSGSVKAVALVTSRWDPSSGFRRLWVLLLLLFLTYQLYYIPLMLAFDPRGWGDVPPVLIVIDLLLDAFHIADIILSARCFHVKAAAAAAAAVAGGSSASASGANGNGGGNGSGNGPGSGAGTGAGATVLLVRPPDIFEHYRRRGRFWVDVAAALPLDLLSLAWERSSLRWWYGLRLARLLRLAHVLEYFHFFFAFAGARWNAFKSESSQRLLIYSYYLPLLVHCAACIWAGAAYAQGGVAGYLAHKDDPKLGNIPGVNGNWMFEDMKNVRTCVGEGRGGDGP